MNKHIAAALLTASVAGAGFAGFSITSALADDASSSQATQVQLAEGDEDGPRGDHEGRAEALADIIGISVDDLRAAREAGQTPAEIAEENGVSRDDLVNALVEAKQERIDQAVADGELTQEDADEKSATIEEHVNAFVDGEGHHHGGPGRGPGGPDGPDDDNAPAVDEEVDA